MAIYKFCFQKDKTFQTKYYVGKFENDWLKLDGNKITVRGTNMNGYAWDGCSIKFKFMDILWGTPDGVIRDDFKPATYWASMVHDILYQFKGDIPVSRKTTDLIFLEMLKERKFKLSYIYYGFVRAFGWMFGEWKTKTPFFY